MQFIGIPSILKACSVPISNQRHPTVPFDPQHMASAMAGLGCCALCTVHSFLCRAVLLADLHPHLALRGYGTDERAVQATAHHKYKAGGRFVSCLVLTLLLALVSLKGAHHGCASQAARQYRQCANYASHASWPIVSLPSLRVPAVLDATHVFVQRK